MSQCTYTILGLTLLGIMQVSCDSNKAVSENNESPRELLELMDSEMTGIDFNNEIVEDPEFNIITYDGLLQGAGVAVLDVNNDGLQDIYFAGNQVGDRLYINKGGFKFEDISKSAGIVDTSTWSTGVAVADINEDGFDDIYVLKFLYNDPNKKLNKLYINQQNNTFRESAQEWGLADPGYGIMANFFDYDKDGDLDLYVANQPPNSLALKAQMGNQVFPQFTDRLYRNDGKRFTNVTGQAGLTNFNYTLAVTTFDYNKDGHIDIFLASDYDEPDYLWKNNGDGTFSNEIHSAMRHLSNFSMGSDISDINRDGHLDLFVVDMVAEDNYRQKTNMSGMNPERFWGLADAGYHYQYMYNAMHLNTGQGAFSEIAHMSGISSTDWSWTPLFIDFDLDGNDDLYITNGIIKETRNKDYNIWKEGFIKSLEEQGRSATNEEIMDISNRAPSVKVLNALFKSNGDLTFEHFEEEWGLTHESWSQGAAYADFDNDGDLDIVVNNMNSKADVIKNLSVESKSGHYINIILEGGKGNSKGFGSKIFVYADGKTYLQEMTPYRGYMSTCQSIYNVGLGKVKQVDSVLVIWPDNKISRLGKTEVDQTVTIRFSDRSTNSFEYQVPKEPHYSAVESNAAYPEDNYDDYAEEVLLPHKMSTLGPFVEVGDVNGDGSDDFYVAGSAGNCGSLWIYDNAAGGFAEKSGPWCSHKAAEDGAVKFVDVDNDDDLDLVVASGGNQHKAGSLQYKDRLYINNGSGSFSFEGYLSNAALSSGTVEAFDYNNDGNIDLFIGGRQIPGKYGFPSPSQILRGDGNGQFTDVTSEVAAGFDELGMVTDAIWTNVDNEGDNELMIVGEWMPISVYRFDGNSFINVSDEFGFAKTGGWWNVASEMDVDQDGTMDYLLGNVGYNIKYKASEDQPFKVYVDDFDDNGTNDIYLGQVFNDGNYYPIRGRQCSSEQMPFIKKEFENYDVFAKTTFDDILGERIDSTTQKNEAHMFASVVLLRQADNSLKIEPLPNSAQISPIFDGAMIDVNEDGKKELAVVGNYYNREVETTRSDASYGTLIRGLGTNAETDVMSTVGLDGSGDVRAIKVLKSSSGDEFILIAVNNDKVRLYRKNKRES